ncbi:MAG: class I SAM-dependent methyltransferase [Selenomonadaceae bacterium]|nr:class I SAM-dependent methyltransferase [Selenomonadaceae bacterium]
MACGAGANTFYMAKKFPNVKFTGIEYDREILSLCEEKAANVRLEHGDWYNVNKDYVGKFNGIVSFQTLSWLSDYKEPLIKLCELEPDWIALTSLFYEGRMNFYIKIEDKEQNQPAWGKEEMLCYNIYSLPMIKDLLAEYGYTHFDYTPFEIDIDIPKPEKPGLGTYTIPTVTGKRLQVSSALLLPWYFVFASR